MSLQFWGQNFINTRDFFGLDLPPLLAFTTSSTRGFCQIPGNVPRSDSTALRARFDVHSPCSWHSDTAHLSPRSPACQYHTSDRAQILLISSLLPPLASGFPSCARPVSPSLRIRGIHSTSAQNTVPTSPGHYCLALAFLVQEDWTRTINSFRPELQPQICLALHHLASPSIPIYTPLP